MRTLLTGGSGFVGTWLRAHCISEGDELIDLAAVLEDSEGVRSEVLAAAPDVIFHLAGQADVGASWADPEQTFVVNALGTLRVLDAARRLATPPRVLMVSSAEVYGRVDLGAALLREDVPARPTSPYGASKLAAEEVALQVHRGWGVPVIVTRAFNHIGPGQSPRFVVSAVARQVAAAERAGESSIGVGNLTPRRDYTDVRDVVRAYRLLVLNGQPGEIYNVCSGRARAVEEVVELLVARARVPLAIHVDPERVRPVDVPVTVGDPGKVRSHTGWSPTWSLEQTLDDVLTWWRTTLESGGGT